MGTKRDDHLASACADAELYRRRDGLALHLPVHLAAVHVFLEPLQRSYITEYIRSEVGSTFNAHESYRLALSGRRKGKPRLAFPGRLRSRPMVLPNGKVIPPRSRIWQSPRATVGSFGGRNRSWPTALVHRWLRLTVYEDQGLFSGLFAVSFERADSASLLCSGSPFRMTSGASSR
jgi:hypothetical protein